jgi:hypothetical protein
MSLAAAITGGVSGRQAEVDVNSNQQVATPQLVSWAGHVILGGEISPASAPAGLQRRSLLTSPEGRLHAALDRPIFYVNFAGSATSANAIPQDVLKQIVTTMTATAGSPNSGFLRLNASAITTVTTGIAYQSYAPFPTYAGYGTKYEWMARTINAGAAAGKVIELGAGFITDAKTPGLLDGFCLRWNAAGEVRGYVSLNGAETPTPPLAIPSDNVLHRFTIVVNQDGLYFYVDSLLQAILNPPTDQVGTGFQTNPPLLMRLYNNTAPALAAQLEVAECWVTQGGMDWNMPWNFIQSGMGQHASNVPFGTAIGETPGNTANASAIPAASAGSNTAALVTGLGGVGQMTAQVSNVAAAGDMIATSYQVPAQTATQGSKRFVCTGVRISALNNGAIIATTATVLLWGIAWGHTAVSLATADAVGAKAPRHLKLGFQYGAIGCAIGQTYSPENILVPLVTPVTVNPGEFLASTVRFVVGTATASQAVLFVVAFDGFWM